MELGSSGYRVVDSLCASSERPASDVLQFIRLRCPESLGRSGFPPAISSQCMSERGVSYVCAAALV